MNTRREFLMWMAAAAAAPALSQLERLERRGGAQRVIVLGAGLAGLCSAYELQNQGHGQKPGAWLRSQGASAGAAELIALGFGTDFGSAASFLLHGLNSRGSTISYRIEGGNDRLPEEFAKRVELRYGAPVVGVSQDDRGCASRFAEQPEQRR